MKGLVEIRLWMVLVMVSIAPGLHANINPSIKTGHFSLVGEGQLKWFGMTVYNARLYAPGGAYQSNQPHAIEITYKFGFNSEQLARKTLEEIERLYGNLPDRSALLELFKSVFPDVARGDQIIAVHHPGRDVEFYAGDVLLGRIVDAELAEMFFAIWLDPRTRERKLRADMLGFAE